MENYTIEEAVQKMAIFAALLYYHLSKAMVEDFGEDAKKTIEKAIERFGFERGKMIAERVKKEGLELTVENLDKFYDIPISTGWSPEGEYKYGHEGVFKKFGRTLNCIFADVWIERDWQEIGKIYCKVDAALRKGYNPDIKYVTIKNILSGDECCESITEYEEQ